MQNNMSRRSPPQALQMSNTSGLLNSSRYTFQPAASLRQSWDGHQSRSKLTFPEIMSYLKPETPKQKRLPKVGKNELMTGIFEIHGIGINYSSSNGYGAPRGIGFLITKNLILTTHSVIPTEESALMSQIKFMGIYNEIHRLDPNQFFYTDGARDITITSLVLQEGDERIRYPLEARHRFKLLPGETLNILNGRLVPSLVSEITDHSFTFKSKELILPGTPLFSKKWKLQGIFVSGSNSYNSKQARRLDSILTSLLMLKNTILAQELENFLLEYAKFYQLPTNLGNRLADSNTLFWVQWNSPNVYQFDEIVKDWKIVTLNNINEFKGYERQHWGFPTNSRLVNLQDGSIMIVGGKDPNNGKSRRDTFQVFPNSGVILRKGSMLEGRAAHCLIYRYGYVYAMGGIPSGNTCERYSIQQDSWVPITSLNIARCEASACTFNNEKFMLIIGGLPENAAGNSIERYSFEFNRWQLLELRLPNVVINPALYQVSPTKLAIFGGRISDNVFIFETEGYSGNETEELLRLYQVDLLPRKVKCLYPVTYRYGRNVLYILCERVDSLPDIHIYDYKRLLGERIGDVIEVISENKSIGGVLNHMRLLTPDYRDAYF
ncbi:unnamed protein product [Blepharisma stoltei]|uniref:Trypsin-like serine protease n=1 Tax=Blepharisma stoltei TaxID=1481888 RepID=A0AAU9J3G1_9CILI|nr:unnamed protein product [Blepharisma stoltei]